MALKEQENLSFDPDFLRNKYRERRRDKRVKLEGNDQYIEVKGDFSYFVEDPYIEEKITRDPEENTYHTIIIGGGLVESFQGSIREQGIHDFRIIEKVVILVAPGIGIGIEPCDIESYIYFPMLEETKFIPKQKYTDAAETLDYFNVLSEKFSLKENALFQTEVNEVEWLADEDLWLIKTNRQIL